RAFGTGAVKVTPAHDATDLEIGRRHGLASIDVMTDDGAINEHGAGYAGLDRFTARTRILEDLAAAGDLEAERAHEMVLGRCQRSDDIVEPRLKTQWFIRTAPLAERALAVTRARETRILPERFEKTWEHWLTGIRDWNVSRQLWWGHRIPAWYCPDGHITVSELEGGPPACATCGRPAADLRQDPDIFDTWFSSGLWPFSTLGWPDATDDLARYYPGSVMETGYDILFFWVARMVMMGLALLDETPFETVYLSGLIRDPYGKKMSKTTGNVIDPLEIIDTTGADALRFALIHGATPGLDQKLSEARIENARNFANKLWNATRYVLGSRPESIPANAPRQAPDPADLGPAERWIRSRRAATIEAVGRAIADFQFAEMTRALYEAIWSEYCDWGLELAKVRLADTSLPDAEREAAWWTLVEALDTYLRLLHPVMPFVTEELWGALPHATGDPDLLIVAAWPEAGERDERLEAELNGLIELVGGIRNARAEAGIAAAAWLPVRVTGPATSGPTFKALLPAIERLSRSRPLIAGPRTDLDAVAGGGLVVIAGD
ncbi:MAG: valine--tRNA ligase, partial [Chloroflexota bacterium]